MKYRSYSWLLVIALITIPFLYAWYLYPNLPDSIPTHFGPEGNPDQYGGRSSIFVGPVITAVASLIVYLLLVNIKRLDPKRQHQPDDNALFSQFAMLIVVFLSLISLSILYVTSHPVTSIEGLLLPIIGIFFAAIGRFLPKLPPNYFAGLRLPWTLDNKDNWKATHTLAGKIWMTGGLIIALAGLLMHGKLLVVIFVSGVILMVLIPVIYSFNMFQRGNRSV